MLKIRGKINNRVWEVVITSPKNKEYVVVPKNFSNGRKGYSTYFDNEIVLTKQDIEAIKKASNAADTDYLEVHCELEGKIKISEVRNLTPKLPVIPYYSQSIEKFGSVGNRPTHRFAYGYVNENRIAKKEVPSTEYYLQNYHLVPIYKNYCASEMAGDLVKYELSTKP